MEEVIKKLKPTTKKHKLEAMLDKVSQEMYLRNKELAETNKTLSLLGTIDALVLESHADLKTVCEHITEAITQTTGYPFVGLFSRPARDKHHLTLYGWSGKDYLGANLPFGFSHPLHLNVTNQWLDEPENQGMLISLEGVEPDAIAQYLDVPVSEIKKILKKMPLKSVYCVKLIVRRRLVGLLAIGFYNPADQLAESDTKLIDRLSETIGVAIDNKMLFEENQKVLRQLKVSNTKLRELDETKDDFISMASHQLRTPLTSVKGYLSMVIEGDVGKITPTQKSMLGQAFFSSQRMVYLIADLLNVSRLKTGKFVIEPTAVNLADVVEQELGQLTETAKSRKLTLIYHKPSKFPTVMIDETKTRQVIMNFVDNAIYYTPAGGHIEVKLVDSGPTVELRVEDDGIGVPRSEQAHMFTKFYRAGNARKARPDGTGLGLFMAKKVIAAQGGSIIFHSKEGKGSTFGFVFSKVKLAEAAKKPVPPTGASKAAPAEDDPAKKSSDSENLLNKDAAPQVVGVK